MNKKIINSKGVKKTSDFLNYFEFILRQRDYPQSKIKIKPKLTKRADWDLIISYSDDISEDLINYLILCTNEALSN